jgi:DNA-binding NarL/FixJ family response regulator
VCDDAVEQSRVTQRAGLDDLSCQHHVSGQSEAEHARQSLRRRQREQPELVQIYGTGACGDVTAGKYNDGNHANRDRLAERLYQAMITAWKATERHPLTDVTFRTAPLTFQPSEELGYTRAEMSSNLTSDDADPNEQAMTEAAWREGLEVARAIKRTHPHIGIILLSASMDGQHVVKAIRAGVAAYTPRNISPATAPRSASPASASAAPSPSSVLPKFPS